MTEHNEELVVATESEVTRETEGAQAESRSGESRPHVVVVTPEGMAVSGALDGQTSPIELVEEPAKVMRIGSMIKQLLEEVRNAPLDDAGRARLAEIHQRSLRELEQGLSPELVAELERITLPFAAEEPPTDAELRIAQAQLVGWLEGLFHGIQTALFAQQMAARTQLEQMRRALPAGGPGLVIPGLGGSADHDSHADDTRTSPGQYL